MSKTERWNSNVRTPLFSDEELDKARHHKKRKVKSELALQPRLIEDPGIPNKLLEVDAVFDPEIKLAQLHDELQDRFKWNQNEMVGEDIKYKRDKLRKRIGLPVVRGKDPHVNDSFYKFLVTRIYKFDTFGIFQEYDRVLDGVPEKLNLKINKISNLVNELLDGGLNMRERFEKYHEFVNEHKEES